MVLRAGVVHEKAAASYAARTRTCAHAPLALALALALLSLAAAVPVLVDKTNARAVNAAGCGVDGAPPCLTIDFGVAQALDQSSDDATHTLHVQGGGMPYLGECCHLGECSSKSGSSGSGDDYDIGGGDRRGIVIPPSVSFVVVGLDASNDDGALVGAPVIDCERKGRAFTYFDDGGVVPVPGRTATAGALAGAGPAGPQLTLVGLVIRNGVAAGGLGGGAVLVDGALVLRRCAFEGCSAGSLNGGAVASILTKTRGVPNWEGVFLAEDSNFTACESGAGGGGVAVFFSDHATDVSLALRGCSFVSTTNSGSGGGGAVFVYFFNPATDVTTSIANSSFAGCNATGGDGGAVSVVFTAITTNVTTSVADSSFVNTTSSGIHGGGAVSITFNFPATDVTTSVANSNFSDCNATVGNGGAVVVTHLAAATDSATIVTGSNSSGNTASGNGGALALSAPADSTRDSHHV
jgi:hypothetical protein